MAFIDGSVVNVGLPAIGRSFHADATGLQWVVNAYLLPLSALLLLGGAAGDRYGRRRLLIAGVLLFGLASLACAVAPTLVLLLIARFVQGASAAMLMPNSLAILGQSFSGEAKGRAIGIWAATGAAAGAIGPVLGGWLIDAGSWRLAFLINVPLAAAAIALASRYVDRDIDDTAGSLDWLGGALATAGLGLATWALTEGSGRAWSPSTFVVLGAGLIFSLLFLSAERRLGDNAMMPLSLFGSPSFVGLTLLTLLLYGALGGLFVLVPYVLIQAGGYTATQAGAALLPLPLVIAVASPAAGALAARVGPRWLLITGPVIVAAGFLLTLRIGSATSYWLGVFPAMVVIALGMACAVAPLTTAVLMSVDSQPHRCSIRAEQRSSAYWRVGRYSPYRTCDSVIRTCVAFSFWCRRSDRRRPLLGSSGERFYVDRPGGENPTIGTTMMTVLLPRPILRLILSSGHPTND